MDVLLAVISFAVVAGLTLAATGIARRWDPVARRLRGLQAGTASRNEELTVLRWDDKAAGPSPWQRILERLGTLLLPRRGEEQEVRKSVLRLRLIQGGFDHPRSVALFLGSKIALAGAFAYGYTLYGLSVHRVLPNLLLVSLVLAGIGFFLPDFWLSQRIKVRRRLIANALPDVLDLLVVCVEAGLGLDAAIARVTEPGLSVQTPLHEELRRVHLEFRLGRARDEALRALSERTGVDHVASVVGAFIQTEKLGTSLAHTLRVHAEAARVMRRHRAEKAAYLAPVKMLFPIVFFLFPAVFVVTVAPAVLRVMQAFRGLAR
jgi:tight adherence protein C